MFKHISEYLKYRNRSNAEKKVAAELHAIEQAAQSIHLIASDPTQFKPGMDVVAVVLSLSLCGESEAIRRGAAIQLATMLWRFYNLYKATDGALTGVGVGIEKYINDFPDYQSIVNVYNEEVKSARANITEINNNVTEHAFAVARKSLELLAKTK